MLAGLTLLKLMAAFAPPIDLNQTVVIELAELTPWLASP